MRAWAIGLCSVALLAACGDSIQLPAADAPVDDRTGLVTLTVQSDLFRVDDLLVYFQAADSQLVLSTRTDGAGVANAFMADGGFVTVINPSNGQREIYTYAGVKSGDQLVLDLRNSPNLREIQNELQVPFEPTAMFYELSSSCAFGSPTELFPRPPESSFISLFGCPEKVNFLLRAHDGMGMSRYLYQPGVPIDMLGPLQLEGSYEVPRAATLSVIQVPADITDLFVTQQLDGIPLQSSSVQSLAPVAGEAQIALELPVADGAVLATRLDALDLGTLGVQHVIQIGPNDSTAIDLRGGLRAYTSRPTFEPTTQTIQWTEASSGVIADFVITDMNFFGPEGSSRWAVFGPRGAEPRLRLPMLPRVELNPTDAESVFIFTLLNVAIDGGYDRVRPDRFGTWLRNDVWPTDRVPGQALFQTLGNGLRPD